MRILLMTLLMVLSAMTICSQVKYTRLERELFKLQREWLDARQNGALPTLDRIEARDFIEVDGDGRVFTKENRTVTAGKHPRSQDDSMDTMESRIRIFGNGAVITGRLWMKHRNKDRIVVEQFAYTHTFVKRPAGWQIVASQLTRIPT
jgi:hypothetical protein